MRGPQQGAGDRIGEYRRELLAEDPSLAAALRFMQPIMCWLYGIKLYIMMTCGDASGRRGRAYGVAESRPSHMRCDPEPTVCADSTAAQTASDFDFEEEGSPVDPALK